MERGPAQNGGQREGHDVGKEIYVNVDMKEVADAAESDIEAERDEAIAMNKQMDAYRSEFGDSQNSLLEKVGNKRCVYSFHFSLVFYL